MVFAAGFTGCARFSTILPSTVTLFSMINLARCRLDPNPQDINALSRGILMLRLCCGELFVEEGIVFIVTALA
jgi:hypothetical protein